MEVLQGKHVLVAGATGGIGRETARLLHQSGAVVYMTGRRTEALLAVAGEIGIPANRSIIMDVTQPISVRDAITSVHAQCGKIDILINTVGLGIIKPIELLTHEEFMQSLNVNLVGAFLLVKECLPPMKDAKKGLIINLPGVLGKTPMAGAMAYSAAKYGLNGMMKSLREELKRTDIRITNIFLGGTDTPFWDIIDMRVQREKFVTAKEAAKAIWFLCQQPSSGVVSEFVLQPFNHQAI